MKDKLELIKNPNLMARITGDAGEYQVWGVDWMNERLYVYRACGYEWVPFKKVRDIKAG